MLGHLRKKQHRILLTLLLVILVSLQLVPVRAQPGATDMEACAFNPQLLDGQGFAVSGLGFAVSGLGFAVSGLGFAVSGLELTPQELAQEIVDNPVSTDWLINRLADIQGGDGFNETRVAVLVVDDFGGNIANTNPPAPDDTHGKKVTDVSNKLLADLQTALGSANIVVVPVDVSGGMDSYRVGSIRSRIEAAIASLEAQGIHHFVLNLSFGVLPCDSDIMLDDGTMVPWNFDTAVQAINDMAEFHPVIPKLECVSRDPDNSFTAHFGFDNPNGSPVTVPVGSDNFLTGGNISAAELTPQTPTYFSRPNVIPGKPGRSDFYPNSAFQVRFKNGSVQWTLFGKTVTAKHNDNKQRCSSNPHPIPNETSHKSKTPPGNPGYVNRLDCVVDNENGTLTGHFGYSTPFGFPTYVQHDSALSGGGLSSAAKYGLTPRYFGTPAGGVSPAFPTSAIQITFSAVTPLSWTLFGNTVTASSTSPKCVIPQGFGVSQYLVENYIQPQQFNEFLTKALNKVANDTSNPLQGLQTLLQNLYARNLDGTGFAAIAVASAGNTRYLYPRQSNGMLPPAPPVSPASMPETIASSALLGPIEDPLFSPLSDDNRDLLWRLSHDGNVAAPGGGIELSPDNWLVGTSFSAPYTSMIAALWLTYEDACTFTPGVPPLNQSARDFVNALFSDPTIDYPLNCALPSDEAADVVIDIRPFVDVNFINLNSEDKVPVVVFSSPDFNALTIDADTVMLAGAPAVPLRLRFPKFETYDVNHDGRLDKIFYFDTQSLAVTEADTSATLTGMTTDGQAFQGTDSIHVIPLLPPTLLWPPNGARYTSHYVWLNWFPVALDSCYSVQVHNAPFSGPDQTNVFDKATVVHGTSYWTDYLPRGTYYWRVRVGGTCNIPAGPWSEVRNFSVR